jgi:hypothetical protein
MAVGKVPVEVALRVDLSDGAKVCLEGLFEGSLAGWLEGDFKGCLLGDESGTSDGQGEGKPLG